MTRVPAAVLRAARAYTDLSQETLAKRAGVATRTVFKREKQGAQRDDPILEKILAVLRENGVTLDFGDDGAVRGLLFFR